MKKELLNVYCDMDGVIADFEKEINAVERFKNEKGFFRNLEPMNVEGFEKLLALNGVVINLYILSASPNKRADKDKIAWLKKYYPSMKRKNIIIMRNGKNKSDYMKTKNGVLFDDYGKNCREWRERGNVAIKVEKSLLFHINELLD